MAEFFSDPPAATNSHGFPSEVRVKSREEFAAVFKNGKVAADGVLVIHALRATCGPTRLGLSISKKVGCAPLRNRWKRLIREAFRLHRREYPEQLLLVVRPKRGGQPNFQAIENSLKRLIKTLDRRV